MATVSHIHLCIGLPCPAPPQGPESVTWLVFRLCRWGSLPGRTAQQEEQTARDWRDDEPIWKEAELSRLVFTGS